MRRKRRSAATIPPILAGACLLVGGLFLIPMSASAQNADADIIPAPDPEAAYSDGPTPEELARPERADYWAARAAREERRAERRGEPIPAWVVVAEEPAPVSNGGGDGGGGGGGEAPAATPAASDGGGSGGGPSDEQLAMLRQCESGGDYAINTGNGYYGAYQFLPSTWSSLGYSGYPHEAAPEVQDQAVRDLWAQAGWYPWPGCSASFGWI